jgi:hypothetical protein
MQAGALVGLRVPLVERGPALEDAISWFHRLSESA